MQDRAGSADKQITNELPLNISKESTEFITSLVTRQAMRLSRKLILKHGREFQLYLKDIITELARDEKNVDEFLRLKPEIMNTALNIFIAEGFKQYYIEVLRPSLNDLIDSDL